MSYFLDSPTKVMGIINITEDSFSDGSTYLTPAAAIQRANYLASQGAEIIDVGAESTRPGATRVAETVELQRLIPLVKTLAEQGLVVSVDTMRAEVARQAIQAGAKIINDVSGGLADMNMKKVVAATEVDIIVNHWPSAPRPADSGAGVALKTSGAVPAINIVEVVLTDLAQRIREFLTAGVAREKIIIDPGLGFGKTYRQSWELLANIAALKQLNTRILVGASRKKFLSVVTKDATNPQWGKRDLVTATISELMAAQHIWAVRVHEL